MCMAWCMQGNHVNINRYCAPTRLQLNRDVEEVKRCSRALCIKLSSDDGMTARVQLQV